jgi:hypothetical protein
MPARAASDPINKNKGIVTKSRLVKAAKTSGATVPRAAGKLTCSENINSPVAAIDTPTGTCNTIRPIITATPKSSIKTGASSI